MFTNESFVFISKKIQFRAILNYLFYKKIIYLLGYLLYIWVINNKTIIKREKPGPLKRNRVITICFYPKRAAGTALFKTFQKYEKINVSSSYCCSINSF